MADKIYVGDVGTLFRVDCQTDISTATVRKLEIKKPDETTHDWTASLYGTDQLEYTIVADDLDQEGVYQGHAYVELPSGKWRGERFTFTVYSQWD
jgi:hypothetical protein